MKNFQYLLGTAILIAVLLGISIYQYWILPQEQYDRDVLFQASTIDALLVGVYDGDLTFKDLHRYGDIGIGTFDDLDGEMIALDGKFYQIKINGVAYPVNDSMQTPLSVMTFFEPDKDAAVHDSLNSTQLELYLESLLPTKNIFYAFKIQGLFEYIKTRSVPRQSKPYPPLAIAVQDQSTFEFHKVSGTIVGFRTPYSMSGVNVPGYHFHFITEDKKAGGHLLELTIQNVTVEIDFTPRFQMFLPGTDNYYKANLTKDNSTPLEQIE